MVEPLPTAIQKLLDLVKIILLQLLSKIVFPIPTHVDIPDTEYAKVLLAPSPPATHFKLVPSLVTVFPLILKIVLPKPVHDEILLNEYASVFELPLPVNTYIVKLSPEAIKNDPFDVIPLPTE